MFKGYHNSNSSPLFRGIPNLNFQGNVNAYGFTGVSFWLDAAFGLNTQTNLDAVSRWQPIIGRSPFIQNTAANQPRLIASDVNYNNLPSVESTANNRFMQSDTNAGLPYSRNCTIAVVSKVNTANGVNGIIGINTGGVNGIFDGGTGVNHNGFGIQDASVIIMQGTTESTNARIKVISFNNVIVNGVSETTGTGVNSNIEYFQIFRNVNSTAGNLIGTIAEIIAFNFSMTSQQCIDLSNNINQKYALY